MLMDGRWGVIGELEVQNEANSATEGASRKVNKAGKAQAHKLENSKQAVTADEDNDENGRK